MTEVLVVARTRYGGDVCVGGLRLDLNKNVRLMTAAGEYQPTTSPYQVGHVYDATLIDDAGAFDPPHSENVRVLKSRLLRSEADIAKVLAERVPIVRGAPGGLFGGVLRRTSGGRLYVSRSGIPAGSVDFWIADRALVYEDRKYVYRKGEDIAVFTYAGVADAADEIPAGALIRISLARWWRENQPQPSQRCYTQVSGWY